MAMKINAGLTRKVGTPNYGSIAASCAVEFQVESGLEPEELDGFHRQVRNAYTACRDAVVQELARLEASLVDPDTGEDLGIPLVGIVDLILDGRQGPIIADFKTSGRSAEPLEITHEIQLSSYAFLFRHVEQRPEAELQIRSLIKTKVPKAEFHTYPARTEVHFRRLFSVIREYLDALDAGRFNYRPGFGCTMCEFRETHCRGWQG